MYADVYRTQVVPALKERFGFDNDLAVPRLEKIMVSMGIGRQAQDQNPNLLDNAMKDLGAITGQKPSVRRAKKSVSAFRVRRGDPVGCMVTLRGTRMYEFFMRLVKVALPQIRDFRGLNANAFDGRGNYALGVQEQIIFPELGYDEVAQIRGMNIVIVTTAKNDEQARELLRLMGVPFREPQEARAAA
jgi:large subunit ribosomal protein L5